MLEPVSQVDDSNYHRLGNKLVGESRSSRMARVRRQSGTSTPTLGLVGPSPLGPGGTGSGLAEHLARLDSPYDFSSGGQIVGPIYGLMSGAAAGAVIAILGNAFGVKPSNSAMAAIVAGSTVALAAPKVYGASYQAEMGLPGRVLTTAAMGTGAFAILASLGGGRYAERTLGEVFEGRNLMKIAGYSLVTIAGSILLGYQTIWGAKPGTFSNAMFTAAPLGLAAGVVAGFAHGAIRKSEISQILADPVGEVMLPHIG